ncbi:MAG: hypothetical protein IT233_12980 [Bacteroidia bacterium]|nr:hypothetical protein [Bacteroidia bacterium]
MKWLIFFFVPLCLLLVSCKGEQKVTQKEIVQTPPPPPPPPSGGSEDATNEPVNYRLVLSFYSIGSGIDNAHHEKWVELLNKHSPVLLYDKAGWGREGEVDYCLMLKELKPDEQVKFIASVKELLVKCEWVHIEEYKPCKNKK